MIIVITNRKLPVVPQDQAVEIAVKDLGVDLGEIVNDQGRIYTGEFLPEKNLKPQYKEITFQAKNTESEIFDNIPQVELDKPWVFFVHGFHQDAVENIEKAISLQDSHKVNVIVFAWPSRPLDKTMSRDDVVSTSVKNIIKGFTWGGLLADLFLSKVKSEIEDKWENYLPAIANAEKSTSDLMAAINLVNEELRSAQSPVLLVHSMGNYLLENTISEFDELPMKFSNIMLHEADVTVPGYDWVKKLNASLKRDSSRLYVTTNEEDYVLLASKGRRAILKKTGDLPDNASTERLGRYIENYIAGDIHYLDFSYAEKVNDEHEFFNLASDETNANVHACLGRIFRAEDDGLPVNNAESKSGFSKMPTDANLYRLEEVIHIADLDMDLDEILLVKSLDEFNKQQTSSINSLDDEDMFGSYDM